MMNNKEYDMEKTDMLINRLDEWMDFINVLESNDNKTLKENTDDYIQFQKHFISSHKIENVIRQIYEETGNDKDNDIDSQVKSYIMRINKLSNSDESPLNQLIYLSMKGLVLSSLYTNDESKKKSLIKHSMNIRKLTE